MKLIIDFSHKIREFVKTPGEGIKSLQDLLLESAKKFFSEYDDIDPKEFVQIKGFSREIDADSRKRILRARLENLIDRANAIIPRTIQNDYAEVHNFYNLFFEEDGSPKEEANIKSIKRESLYHIATTEKYKTMSRGELFVLPNKLLNKSGKYRYNLDGSPCIYMGTTLYNAWEETRRPDFEKANFVRFVPQKKLMVMSIYAEPRIQSYGDFVMAYFTMISSIKTDDGDKYHYQYVVPNLFMSALTHANNVCEKDAIDGIRYLSSRSFDGEDYLFNSYDIDEAFVFPQRLKPDGKPDNSYLCKLFRMSDPRSYFYYKIHLFDFAKGAARVTKYRNSLFHAIEEQLKREEATIIDIKE